MHFNGKKAITMLVITSMLLSFAVFNSNLNIAPAQLQTTLRVRPPETIVPLCTNFTVDASIIEVFDLFQYAITVTFDPTLMDLMSVDEGPFLGGVPGVIIFFLVPGPGWVEVVSSRLEGTGGRSGSGILFYLNFHCKGLGSSLLHLEEFSMLQDSNKVDIPYQTVDGYVTQVYNRNVAVSSIAKRNIINRGELTWRAYINVTVLNEGSNTETFYVNVYAINATSTIVICAGAVCSIPPGIPTTLNFFWNTVGWKVGNYTIRAEVPPLLGETNLTDNYYSDGIVTLKLLGDLGSGLPPQYLLFDKKCDGIDLALFVNAYKGLAGPHWWLGDLGGPVGITPKFFAYDGIVDAYDLALFIQCYAGLGP